MSKLKEYSFRTPLFGDLAMLFRLFQRETWETAIRALFRRDALAILSGVLEALAFFVAALALPVRVFLRYRHGLHTIGWIILAYAGIAVSFLNWADREYLAIPLYPFWFLIREGYAALAEQEITNYWQNVFLDVRSVTLFWVNIAFVLIGVYHIIASYFLNKNDAQAIYRGLPLLWVIAARFNRRLRDRDRMAFWWVLESALFLSIGTVLVHSALDRTLGWYLIYAGAGHFALEFIEYLGKRATITAA